MLRRVCVAAVAVSALVAAANEDLPLASGWLISPAAAQTVLASAEFSADPDLRCDLLEVKRVSGGALLVRWRITNTADQGSGLTANEPKKIYYSFEWNQLYFIDPQQNKKYEFLTDSQGNRILEMFSGYIEAGKHRTNWAKFPAPPPGSSVISVSIPNFPPFEDIPIAQ